MTQIKTIVLAFSMIALAIVCAGAFSTADSSDAGTEDYGDVSSVNGPGQEMDRAYALSANDPDNMIYKLTSSVTFDANGGELIGKSTAVYHVYEEYVFEQTATRTGYVFSGWAYGRSNTPIPSEGTWVWGGPMALHAMWTPEQYSVVLNPNGGVLDGDGTATATYCGAFKTNATRDGTAVTLWNTKADGSGDAVRYGDLWKFTDVYELFAQKDPAFYTLTFVTNGGTFVNPPVTGYEYGSKVFLPVADDICRLDGSGNAFKFNGWYKNNDFLGGKFASVSESDLGDLVFYANWEVYKRVNTGNYYLRDVWFDANGGELIGKEHVFATLLCPFYFTQTAVRTGYVFAGWEYNGKIFENGTCWYNDPAVLYARWVPEKYTVALDPNYGIIKGGSTVVIAYDSEFMFSPNISREGFAFDGWNSEADGSGIEIRFGTVWKFQDIKTLYAQWTRASEYADLCFVPSDDRGISCDETDITKTDESWDGTGNGMPGSFYACITVPEKCDDGLRSFP